MNAIEEAQSLTCASFVSGAMVVEPDLKWERALAERGHAVIAGLDEVGRGAWAGPVVAAAVALGMGDENCQVTLRGVRDSKRLTPRQRVALVPCIEHAARATGIGFVSAGIVDRIGIVPATRLAMLLALAELDVAPDYLLIDGLSLPELDIPQQAIIKGDAKCLSVAAASVLAKVARDTWMIAQESHYPGYGFAAHKGYGTRQHRQALARLGPCPLHRLSFRPLHSPEMVKGR